MPELKLNSVEDLDKAIADGEKEKKRIFILFTGSPNETGESWCSDCRNADPVLKSFFAKHMADDILYIHCDVGDRATWKTPDNAFRVKYKLSGIPTLIKWKSSAKLVEEQLVREDLLSLMLEDED